MPARSTATQKCVEACLRARAPGELIEAPPAEVLAAAKAFPKFDAAQRLAVIPPLVRWLGLGHDWPELSFEEMNAFVTAARQSRPSYFLPISIAMLFGKYDGMIPDSLSAADLVGFNRGLAIMKTQRLWGSDRLYKKAPAAVPVYADAGPENARIIACFLEIETPEHRGVLLPFVVKNQRWEIFDALEEGFARGRGALKSGDELHLSFFAEHRDLVSERLQRLRAAAVKGREVLKPIWDSEAVVSADAKQRLEQALTRRLGKVWWGTARSKSTSADDIAISIPLSRKVGDAFEPLGTFYVSAQRTAGTWKFSRLDVELAGETVNLL